jgi:hypothetical protein
MYMLYMDHYAGAKIPPRSFLRKGFFQTLSNLCDLPPHFTIMVF